jgi:hypothetical protein
MRSPELLIRISFCTGVSIRDYQMLAEAAHIQHIMKNTLTTLTEISTSARIWYTPLPLSPLKISRTGRHFLRLLTLMGDHYADHCQNSRVYASHHTPEDFSLLCHCTLTATLLMFPLVTSAAKHKICYLYVVKLQAF